MRKQQAEYDFKDLVENTIFRGNYIGENTIFFDFYIIMI